MPPAPVEVLWPQIQGTQFGKILGPQTGKFIQQLLQRLALNLSCVALAIEGLKRLSFAELQDHPHARHPIRAFAVIQMPDDIECAPSVFTFIPEDPLFG
jgi:hypothetical protein